jgi:group I intron endonuclease
MAFVYWIRKPEHNDVTKDGYIGFTSNTVESRLKQHKKDSTREKCKNLPIYNAMRKYGNLLIVETLVEGSDEYCLMIENKLRPDVKIGWNIKIGGDFGSLGVKASDEARLKMSINRSGSKHYLYGKKLSDEVKRKMSLSRGGKYTFWKSPCASDLWLSASEIFSYMKENPTHGAVNTSKQFGVTENQMKTIHRKIRSGWNPNEDQEYLSWLEERKDKDVT